MGKHTKLLENYDGILPVDHGWGEREEGRKGENYTMGRASYMGRIYFFSRLSGLTVWGWEAANFGRRATSLLFRLAER